MSKYVLQSSHLFSTGTLQPPELSRYMSHADGSVRPARKGGLKASLTSSRVSLFLPLDVDICSDFIVQDEAGTQRTALFAAAAV